MAKLVFGLNSIIIQIICLVELKYDVKITYIWFVYIRFNIYHVLSFYIVYHSENVNNHSENIY